MPVRIASEPLPRAAELIEALKAWSPPACYVTGLHAGDIGWQLRLSRDGDGDGDDCGLRSIHDEDELVGVALEDSPTTLRPVIRPDRVYDATVATALVDYVEAMPRTSTAYTDAGSGSAYRSLLSAAGWLPDPDPWVALYRPLTRTDGDFSDPSSTSLASARDVADRVAVQRAAFAGSTFTVERWHAMAAGPGYDRATEYLRRDADGVPVAAATGWSGGQGRCAILEPVGAHPDHAGRGHGKAVSLAVIAALARAGASGVTVWTPASNAAAVRTYESCGLRQVEIARAMTRAAAP